MNLSKLTDENIFNIDRVDRDRGFKIRLELINPETDDKYTYETYVSVYVEDTPWSRKELTNDIVRKALRNLMEEVNEDRPELEFDGATIEERTEVRRINKV